VIKVWSGNSQTRDGTMVPSKILMSGGVRGEISTASSVPENYIFNIKKKKKLKIRQKFHTLLLLLSPQNTTGYLSPTHPSTYPSTKPSTHPSIYPPIHPSIFATHF
jgi:hypothetical protein